MPIYKPTELHQFLTQLGIAPKKGLSQNFLIDGNILRKIVNLVKIEPGCPVLEIGPGPGSLTEMLLEHGAHVIAVEKDQILSQALERLKGENKKLDIYCDDIMNFPLQDVFAQGSNARVIANLPYHLTTPIISQLVPMRQYFSSLILMVQEEVGRRMTAKPGSKEYSSFTIFLNFYSKPSYAFTVSPHSFFPAPKVKSAVILLELREPPKVSDEQAFFEVTRTAFEHRRKMLRSSLKALFPPESIEKALIAIDCNPQARPEELSLDQFLQFFELLSA